MNEDKAPPTLWAAKVWYAPSPIPMILKRAATTEFSLPVLAPAEEQDAAEWPRVERLLRKRGVKQVRGKDGRLWFAVGYRDLQAIAGLVPNAVIASLDWKEKSGGASAQKKGERKKSGGASARGAKGRRQGGSQPVRIWSPWPKPAREHVERARRLLHLLYEEISEDAREIAPVGWNHGKLAVRQEMGQLDTARRWERLTTPRLLLALDTSGSMSRYVSQVLALGAALADVLPWLVVVSAPNAELAPLVYNDPGKFLIVDGQWSADPHVEQPRPPAWTDEATAAWHHAIWCALGEKYNVQGVVYVGDWEDENIMPAFDGKRRGVVSVFNSRSQDPTRADFHYGRRTAWPTIVGCGSVEEFLDGLEILLRAWREA